MSFTRHVTSLLINVDKSQVLTNTDIRVRAVSSITIRFLYGSALLCYRDLSKTYAERLGEDPAAAAFVPQRIYTVIELQHLRVRD